MSLPAIRRSPNLAGLLTVVMLLVAGCRQREGVQPQLERRLLDRAFSEERFESTWSEVDRVVLDFRDQAALHELQIADLDFEITSRGLMGKSAGGDPNLLFPRAERPWNQINVELASEADTFLEVYWAVADEPFSEARMQRIDVFRSLEPIPYTVDLTRDLGGVAGGVTLRVDPVTSKSKFTLLKIELVRQSPSLGRAPEKPRPLEGVKVRLGGETRETLVVSSSHPVSWPLSVPQQGASLAFGAAVQQAPRAGCMLRLSFRDQDKHETVLFTQRFTDKQHEWRDWKLSLDRISGRSGSLLATVISGNKGAPAALFWSNPVIGRSDRAKRRPNVILISVDTLGSRHLSAYGAETVGDDFFSNMAKRGALFENAFSNSSLTNISHGSMLTGKFPPGTGELQGLSLAEILRRNGYTTAAFTGGVMVTESLGFDQGFEVFFQEDTLYKDALERSDISQVLSRAKNWLDGTAMEPFFLFLHTYEVHTPYYRRRAGEPTAKRHARHSYLSLEHMRGLNPVTPAVAGRFVKTLAEDGSEVGLKRGIGADDLANLRTAYRGEIALVARELESFFDFLENQAALDNTVIVITSDHGEAFFEHGLFEHGLLYDENLHVPLIIVAPGQLPAGARSGQYVSLVDLVPSILDLAGVASPVQLDGKSLRKAVTRNENDDDATFYSFVSGNGFAWQSAHGEKLIWRAALLQESFGRRELFNRKNDPRERHNLLREPHFIPKQLRLRVRETLAHTPGIHVSLKSYARGSYMLQLAGVVIHPERVFGFDMESDGLTKDDVGWSGLVQLGEDPHLLILLEPDEIDDVFELRLSDSKGALLGRHLVRVGERPTAIPAVETSRTLTGWRVRSPNESGVSPRGLTPEEVERLRALGYLR